MLPQKMWGINSISNDPEKGLNEVVAVGQLWDGDARLGKAHCPA